MIAALAIPALAAAQKVSYDYEERKLPQLQDLRAQDAKVGQPLIDDRIVAAIDAELAAKGS